MRLEVSEERRQDVQLALDMRANWIETGNPVLSEVDLVARGEINRLRQLSEEQCRTVQFLRQLARSLS